MALELSDNWRQELLRYQLAARLTPAQLNELWPAPPGDHSSMPQAQKPGRPCGARADVLRDRGASNNFVVAGSRSATGKPLLANDPHLHLEAPIQWYLSAHRNADADPGRRDGTGRAHADHRP